MQVKRCGPGEAHRRGRYFKQTAAGVIRNSSDSRCGGHSVLEFALFLPFILFLFVGAFDWGFYGFSLIATENAARVATLYTSSSSSTISDSTGACTYALGELADAVNLSGITSCTGTPLTVTATSPDGGNTAQVSVAYQTPLLIPIPGVLPAQVTITRVVRMKAGL